MTLDGQKTKFRALDDWFQTPQGQDIARAISCQLTSISHELDGAIFLQLGICGNSPWLGALHFKRKWLLTPCLDAMHANIIASPLFLPFERNSVDCILAPLTMEAFSGLKNPLSEIDRVLKPMGHLILFGVNPLSLWGVLWRLGYVDCFGDSFPALRSSLFLKQSLLRHGYKQCYLETFYYIPPVKSTFILHKLDFLNQISKMVTLIPAGFYCLVVQKYKLSPPKLIQNIKRKNIILANNPAVGLAMSDVQ